MFAAHKLLKITSTSDHGMFAAHKSLKHQVWDDHGMFAAHYHKYEMNALWRE